MLTPTNQLSVMEVSAYSRQEIEGGVIIRYLVRKPGEREWQPVKLFRPSAPPLRAETYQSDTLGSVTIPND